MGPFQNLLAGPENGYVTANPGIFHLFTPYFIIWGCSKNSAFGTTLFYHFLTINCIIFSKNNTKK
jgi:hypothetical protein